MASKLLVSSSHAIIARALVTRSYASLATAAVSSPPPLPIRNTSQSPSTQIVRHNPLQPPSHRRIADRKAQLLRQYVALLRTTSVLLLFQHNSVLSHEMTAVRRELVNALERADQQIAAATTAAESVPPPPPLAPLITFKVVRSGILDVALRLVAHWDPKEAGSGVGNVNHFLSRAAHDAIVSTNKGKKKKRHGLEPLMSGPLLMLALPVASPAHLAAALSILAPAAPHAAAPKKRVAPGLYERATQAGLSKLMLLGAKVNEHSAAEENHSQASPAPGLGLGLGKVLDVGAVRYLSGLGGLQQQRGQLVGLLQGVGMGLVGALDGSGRSLWMAMEGRKLQLEKEQQSEGGGEAAVVSEKVD